MPPVELSQDPEGTLAFHHLWALKSPQTLGLLYTCQALWVGAHSVVLGGWNQDLPHSNQAGHHQLLNVYLGQVPSLMEPSGVQLPVWAICSDR